ncbi:pathogenesis-related protein 1-like [Iris pallida]|uniref:Pathogenesis-related protein 1-like n=1 Tax=Iris pallida TaxID=29817 RepID=A0AAX6F248_IRIPA|nr:pathogenesis-related protein 1-like [Iris pallida]
MSWSQEIESPVAASRLFKAAYLDWHNLGPKVLPELLVGAALISGDGGVGSIRQLNFAPENPYAYGKEKLDFVDHEKFEATQSLVEGGYLGKKLEAVSINFKFQPTGAADGGCVVRIVATAKVIPGVEVGEETFVRARAGLTARFKAAEAYLLANPTAYV